MLVLYIDDDPNARRMVRKMLQMGGHTMVEAGNVMVGVQTAIRERPDIILMDYNLPYVNGAQGASLLRTGPYGATPIVGVSADYHAMAIAADVQPSAYDALLPKPLDRQSLLETLEELVPQPRHRSKRL